MEQSSCARRSGQARFSSFTVNTPGPEALSANTLELLPDTITVASVGAFGAFGARVSACDGAASMQQVASTAAAMRSVRNSGLRVLPSIMRGSHRELGRRVRAAI